MGGPVLCSPMGLLNRMQCVCWLHVGLCACCSDVLLAKVSCLFRHFA